MIMEIPAIIKYSADDATVGMLNRFNLKVHTLGGKEYAFYAKRSGDFFNYALDLDRDFSFVKVYAVQSKVLEDKLKDIVYKSRISPEESRLSVPAIRSFILDFYKKNEKEIKKIIQDALDKNLNETLRDPNIYLQPLEPLVAAGIAVNVSSKSAKSNTRTAGMHNPFEDVQIQSFEEMFTLISSKSVNNSKYLSDFVKNLIGMDVQPSLSGKIFEQFQNLLSNKSFKMSDQSIHALWNNFGDTIMKFSKDSNKDSHLQRYASARKNNEKISIVDNFEEKLKDQKSQEGSVADSGYVESSLYKLIKKYAQPESGETPSGDSQQNSGALQKQDSQPATDKRDRSRPVYIDRVSVSEQMHTALSAYLTSEYAEVKNVKTPEQAFQLFDNFVKDIGAISGCMSESASPIEMNQSISGVYYNSLLNAITEKINSSGGISAWIPKQDLEDRFKFEIGNSKFLNFLKNDLIPYEQSNPSDKDNLFKGLTGKVSTVDMMSGHVILVSEMSNFDGVPSYIVNFRSTLMRAIDHYRQKYT